MPVPSSRNSASTPRWVIGFGIAALLAVAAFFAVHLTGILPMHHGM